KIRGYPQFNGNGRDGQIRTADLSLRRRPLYPSELRPRTRSDCSKALVPRGLRPSFETLAGDVFAVMHSREIDLFDGCVGVADGAGKIWAGSSNAEDAAAGSLETLRTEPGAGVEHLDVVSLGSGVNSGDLVTASDL